MNNPIYMIAFIFSQLVFFPSYIKCTKLLTGNESSRVKKFIRYFLLSPLSAYILSSFIYTIVGKISPVIRALGGDAVMYIVSFMYLIIYQRIVSKKGNRILGIYIYIVFFLLQSSFTYIFENVWFVIFNQILLTTIISIVVYRITKKYIGAIDQNKLSMTSENKTMLIIPFTASAIKLTQSVVYGILVYNNSGVVSEWLDNFSAYNAVIGNIILIMMICFTSMMFRAMAMQTQLANDASQYKKLSEQSLLAITRAVEAKDLYTKGHSERVAKYSEMIAKKMGYSDNDAKTLYIMALMHDVGKIGIPDAIINKPGALTDEEFKIVKSHPVIGADILKEVDAFEKISEIALNHHERVDGKGYPNGLTGNEISDEVAIVSVADAYDAMTSQRSYRDIMEQAEVRAEIKKGLAHNSKNSKQKQCWKSSTQTNRMNCINNCMIKAVRIRLLFSFWAVCKKIQNKKSDIYICRR